MSKALPPAFWYSGPQKKKLALFTENTWPSNRRNSGPNFGEMLALKMETSGLTRADYPWTWLHKIRKAMVYPNRTKLSGTIEVDEAYIGVEENGGKKGRGTENKTLVAVAVELGDKGALGRARLGVITNASKKALHGFIKDNVEIGSTIISDGWKSYASLSKEGYQHIVYTKKGATSEEELLPNVHRIISLLKRWLLGTHQGAVSGKYLQAYLDEYVFRFNRRKAAQRGLLFYRLLECAIFLAPTTLEELRSSRA